MENSNKKVFSINNEKLLNVITKPIELKAEIIETEEQVKNFGGRIGDYVVILPSGICFILNKALFEAIYQTTPTYCKCEELKIKEEA